jgi:asparagine synthase (glutamine-hydrolysing)
MCGIAGFVNLDGSPADSLALQGMIRTLNHRGPDGTGIYTAGPVGLAHNRLSIIDVEGGHQPMDCNDGSLWITFNGEIFNFVELRRELLQRGHSFSTRSDTEVILRLYEEYGLECVRHMNGQWAFAIWDARKRRLFLSRDRLGVRPLFHTTVGRTFVFGSDVKALFAYPGAEREIDLQTLQQIFTFWFPLPPRTVFKNILELPPGHSMVVAPSQRWFT